MGCSQDKIRFDYEVIAETRKMEHFIFKVPNAVSFSQVIKARLYLECVHSSRHLKIFENCVYQDMIEE